jgi:hypothetical protein
MSFQTETPSPVGPPPADTSLSKWRHLTECLIFAAPYGTAEYLRHLDATGRPYNCDQAIRLCRDLGRAVLAEPIHPKLLDVALHHCHAANDSATFRARYSRLLPKRPTMPSAAERRTGVSEAQRMADSDDLAAQL